jgi:DNA (cytosine-5)-methyltransferase 1
MAGRSGGGYTRVSYPTCVALSGSYELRYGSVCSGVETASLAWEPLGWEPVFFAEIEKYPAAVLAHRYPNVPNLGDMTSADFANKAQGAGAVDVLVGGTPCQSFSVAGLRGGLDDERGNLALEFCRLADRLAPTWVVWENVPGVLSSGGGRDFGSIVGAMGELGYNLAWRILDAQNFGVPQRRRRVFLVGHLGAEQRGAAAVLFEQHCLQGHPAPSRETRQDLAPTVSAGFTASSFGKYAEGCGTLRRDGGDLGGGSETLTIWRGSDQANAETVEGQAGTLNCNKGQQGDNAALPYFRATGRSSYTEAESAEALRACAAKHGDTDLVVSGEVVGTVTARKGRNNGIANDDVQAGHLICVNARETPVSASGKSLPLGAQDRGHAVAFPIDTRNALRDPEKYDTVNRQGVGVGEDGDPAPTVDSSHVDAVATEMQVRRLTPRECERLQGMPDDWTKIPWRKKDAEDCPDGPRYKAIGNSMAVPVMSFIGKRIAMVQEILDGKDD